MKHKATLRTAGAFQLNNIVFSLSAFAIFLVFATACDSEAKKPSSASGRDRAAETSTIEVDLKVLSGKFAPDNMPGFASIPDKYLSRKPQYLDARALSALEKLSVAARKAGYDIKVVSATRNFTTQKAIWEEKFTGRRAVGGKNLATAIKDEEKRALEILRFSSMPGTSRHHWGTDMDFHESGISGPALHNSTFKTGRGKEFYDWLVANAGKFGFCQPYNGDPTERGAGKFAHGYQEERWHWSYRPVAAQYLAAYRQNAEILKPNGFAGDKSAAHFYLDYVENIDASCH